MSQFRRYFCLLYFLASFLDVLDALDDGPLQPLGLLGVKVQEVAEGARVPEPYPQFGMPLLEEGFLVSFANTLEVIRAIYPRGNLFLLAAKHAGLWIIIGHLSVVE